MPNYRVLFNGYDADGLQQLWSTDGTDADTAPIVVAGAAASGLDPTNLVALSSLTVFAGFDASDGSGLWVTDGASASELAVAGALAPAAGGLAPVDITRFGSDALFAGFDASGAQQLWITDGAAAGTVELTAGASVSNADAAGLIPYDIVSLGSRAVFNGLDANGDAQLWATDGAAAHTVEIAPADAAATGLDPQDISNFGTLGLFFGADASGTEGVWKTDGSASGTAEIAQGVGAPVYPPVEAFVPVGSKAVFAGASLGLDQLMSTDGATVTKLLPTGADSAGLQPADITGFGSKALFAGDDASGLAELWVTDGTAAGTTELTAGEGGGAGLAPTDIVDLGPVALFVGQTTSSGLQELFVTDGAAAGTHEVVVPGAVASPLTPADITAFGSVALFQDLDAAGDPQLYSYDVATGAVSEVSGAAAFAAGLGPTELTVAPVQCFTPGARIRTPGGEAAVEDLRPGDLVETGLGRGPRRVRWIGRRRIDASLHPDPALVWPFRVRAGAFGPGLPARDLVLSPDHAVRVCGLLAPVRAFANGMTIAQERRSRIEYLHVELDDHDILFAEGLAVESYLDDGARGRFEGQPAPVLHPDFSGRRAAAACLPLATDPATLQALWRRPARRALKLGFASPETRLTQDPLVRLQAGAVSLAPRPLAPRRLGFALPPGLREARLTSRASSPAAARPWLDDRRRLGVSVARLLVRAADGRAREIALDDPALRAGWHAVERDGEQAWRWTDGDGAIALPPGAARLEVQLAGDMTYLADERRLAA